jgi:hypothetical protein
MFMAFSWDQVAAPVTKPSAAAAVIAAPDRHKAAAAGAATDGATASATIRVLE